MTGQRNAPLAGLGGLRSHSALAGFARCSSVLSLRSSPIGPLASGRACGASPYGLKPMRTPPVPQLLVRQCAAAASPLRVPRLAGAPRTARPGPGQRHSGGMPSRCEAARTSRPLDSSAPLGTTRAPHSGTVPSPLRRDRTGTARAAPAVGLPCAERPRHMPAVRQTSRHTTSHCKGGACAPLSGRSEQVRQEGRARSAYRAENRPRASGCAHAAANSWEPSPRAVCGMAAPPAGEARGRSWPASSR